MASVRNLLALNDPDPKEMTIVEHLEELRSRLIKCLITVTLGAVLGWFFVTPVFDLLRGPISHDKAITLILSSLTEGFLIKLKIAVSIGIALGLPVLLYQTWMFVAPAFSLRSRRYVVPFVLIGIALFAAGAVAGYLLFPRVVTFLLSQTPPGTAPYITVGSYIGQFALVLVIFGVVFELPVVLSFLALIDVVSSRFLRTKRKYAWMIGLIVAMIITPGADPITPFVTAAVVALLYECSIVSIRLMHR